MRTLFYRVSIPKPQEGLSKAAVVFIFWTIVAVIFTTKSNLYYTLKGVPNSWLHLSIHHLASAWTWVLLMPFIYAGFKKLNHKRLGYLKMILLILPLAPVMGLVHSISWLSLDVLFRRSMGYIEGSVAYNLSKMDSIVLSSFFDSTIVFLLIVAFLFGYQLYRSRSGEEKRTESLNRFRVKHQGQYVFVESGELMAVTAEGNYVKLHLADQSPLMVRETMTSFMQRLNGDRFVRINRSFIANLDYVKSLNHRFNGEYAIVLQDGKEAVTSRRFGDSWKKLLD